MIDVLRDYIRAGSLSGTRCETPFLVRVAGPERSALFIAEHAIIRWLSVLTGPALDESDRPPLKTEDVVDCGRQTRAARSSAMEIISVPCEAPRGGVFGFLKSVCPLLQ